MDSPTDLGRAEPDPSTQVAMEILRERLRQQEVEGFDQAHDDAMNARGELRGAALSYVWGALTGVVAHPPAWWPWESRWWKPTDVRRCLVKAAALIIAEIERIDRRKARTDAYGG